MAGQNPSMVIRVAATIAELKANLAEGKSQIETTTAAMAKLANGLEGNKLIQSAHNIVAAVNQIGGVSKLTESEQARVNATLDRALQKYQALGKEAPAAMVALEQATRKVEAPTGGIEARMTAMGVAVGTAVGNVAYQGVMRLVSGVGDLVAQGVQMTPIAASFQRLSASIGETSDAMLASLRPATRGLVTDIDLMLASNKAILLGLPVSAKEMGDLAGAAVTLGRAMGKDAKSSVDDLVTALGRSSPMILDNLGLTVKVGEANDAYAATLGKSSEALTDQEKKLAFYYAALEKAREKVAELGEQTLTLADVAQKAWVSVTNVVTGTVSEINTVGGAIVTSKDKLAEWFQLALQHGPVVAAAMMSVRVESEKLANVPKPAPPVPEVAPVEAYREQLLKLGVAAAALTAEQKAVIREAVGLNQSVAEIASGMGLGEAAVSKYVEALKAADAAEKKAATEAAKHGAAMTELRSSGEGWRGTLAQINPVLVDSIKAYIDAGVSQADLATAYGLTATQIKAVASALTDERSALALENKMLVDTAKLWAEYDALKVQHGATALQAQLAQIKQWADGQALAARQAGITDKSYYDALAALSQEKSRSLMVDWQAIGANSKAVLQEQADKAQATYEYMLAHTDQFSWETIEKFRATAVAAQETANGWKSSLGGALDEVGQKVTAATMTWQQAMEQVSKGLGTMSFTTQPGNVADTPGARSRISSMAAQGRYFGPVDQFGMPDWARIFAQAPGRERGGPVVANQPYKVGERGPELFVPTTSGTIVPSGGGGSVVINVNVGHFVGSDQSAARQLAGLVTGEVLKTLGSQRKLG